MNMFSKAILPAVLLLSTANPCFATGTLELPQFQEKPEYCLFITVDGMDRDYITSTVAPTITAITSKGTVFPDALNVFPTLTSPNMCSLVTGALPITTTIGSNQVYHKDENRVADKLRHNKAVTIAEAFKQQGHSTAAMQQFMLENRGADRYRHTGQYQVPKEMASQGVTSHALEMLDEEIPKLFVLLYQTVDAIGHEYGQDSQEVRKEMALVDNEIARVINVYREAGILDKTLIVITADHGMSSISKKIDIAQVNTAVTDAGFRYALLANTKMKPPTDVDLYIMNYGNLQCYFNRPFNADEKHKLFNAIQQVEGIGTIFDEVTLRRMGAHPNAGDFMVGPVEGYWFGGKGGVHGRNWESDGYQTMAGPGIKAGATVSGVKTIDITPTIQHMFNVPIPHTVDGHVIHEALK